MMYSRRNHSLPLTQSALIGSISLSLQLISFRYELRGLCEDLDYHWLIVVCQQSITCDCVINLLTPILYELSRVL